MFLGLDSPYSLKIFRMASLDKRNNKNVYLDTVCDIKEYINITVLSKTMNFQLKKVCYQKSFQKATEYNYSINFRLVSIALSKSSQYPKGGFSYLVAIKARGGGVQA